jgi:hypothetical protein
MRLLIDANLSPRVAAQLADMGFDAIHVADVGRVAHNLRMWREVSATATPTGWAEGLCTISRAQAIARRPLPKTEEASDLQRGSGGGI